MLFGSIVAERLLLDTVREQVAVMVTSALRVPVLAAEVWGDMSNNPERIVRIVKIPAKEVGIDLWILREYIDDLLLFEVFV